MLGFVLCELPPRTNHRDQERGQHQCLCKMLLSQRLHRFEECQAPSCKCQWENHELDGWRGTTCTFKSGRKRSHTYVLGAMFAFLGEHERMTMTNDNTVGHYSAVSRIALAFWIIWQSKAMVAAWILNLHAEAAWVVRDTWGERARSCVFLCKVQ